LRLDYISRIAPGPSQVRSFLEKHVPLGGTREARFIMIETVDDFLAFDAARRFALAPEVPAEIARHFEFEFTPDSPPHDSEWLRCANFIVRRQTTSAQRRLHAQ